MKKRSLSIVLNTLILVSCGVGLYLSIFSNNFMNTGVFLYYTIQTNILTMISSIMVLSYDFSEKNMPNFICLFKYITTCGIVLTCLIFFLVLSPQLFKDGNIDYLLSMGNFTVHFLTPVLAVLSLICDNKFKTKKYSYLYGLILPLAYFSFIMFLAFQEMSLFKNMDGTITKFPYFFLDFEVNGWFNVNISTFSIGVFYWVIVIFIVSILISKLLLNLVNKKKAK